ncbi:MAG: hypothetical protein H8E38_01875 [SAR324 cluster bacterium]|nr:hypothetical protein [SAR324 cluster bacterium]MBL7034251.1 hypothetical protein [SAR324 cluster bacterium]
MKKWPLFIIIFLVARFAAIGAESGISWKQTGESGITISAKVSATIPEVLKKFFQVFARNPENIQIDPAVTGVAEINKIRGSNPETILSLLLSRHDLTLVTRQNRHRIVLRTDAWRYRPFRKVLKTPVLLEKILRELAETGQLAVHFQAEHLKKRKVIRNLNYSSVEEAIFDLARRQNAIAVYYPGQHVLAWTQDPQFVTKSVPLKNISPEQVHTFLVEVRKNIQEIRLVDDSYPTANLLILRGAENSVSLAIKLVQQWDYESQDLTTTIPEPFTATTEIEAEVEAEDLQLIPESKIVRLPLKYLSVGSQAIQSSGQKLTIPGVEESLKKALQQRLEDETEIPLLRPQIIPDFLGNALILEGSKAHVEWMEKLVHIWDRPLPLIRIEAHLFETSETHSRQLGLEFRGKSVSTDGTVIVSDQGPFSSGFSLGTGAASSALRVDAVLRMLQSEGKGRMLSRPVVVTLNNVEAEMNSGSVLHIKITTEKTSSLQELKTGITLRVTPRLIEDSDNESNNRIWLKVYAETSSPVEGSSIDGIPPINTQRAQTQIFVKDGQPFLLGGLIKNKTAQNQSGIPFFKDLPLVGPFFSTSGTNKSFDHVLVFVTPTRVLAEDIQKLPQLSELGRVRKTPILVP